MSASVSISPLHFPPATSDSTASSPSLTPSCKICFADEGRLWTNVCACRGSVGCVCEPCLVRLVTSCTATLPICPDCARLFTVAVKTRNRFGIVAILILLDAVVCFAAAPLVWVSVLALDNADPDTTNAANNTNATPARRTREGFAPVASQTHAGRRAVQNIQTGLREHREAYRGSTVYSVYSTIVILALAAGAAALVATVLLWSLPWCCFRKNDTGGLVLRVGAASGARRRAHCLAAAQWAQKAWQLHGRALASWIGTGMIFTTNIPSVYPPFYENAGCEADWRKRPRMSQCYVWDLVQLIGSLVRRKDHCATVSVRCNATCSTNV